jgi:GLPGLI family protein
MSRRFLLLWISFALALPMRAQWWNEDYDTLCPARLMVMYELTFREDSNHLDRANTEKMMLLIGDGVSFFQSYTAYRVSKNFRQMMQNAAMVSGQGEPIRINVASDDIAHFQYKVYKNHPSGKVIMRDHVFMAGSFLYEEDYPCMTWEYTEDTATIAGYFIQKAVCNYGGRIWEAWFAPELPFNDGPYKFCGLPGLIVKVADTQDHYRFEMLSVEIPEETFIFWDDRDAVKTTKKAFFKMYDDNMANIIENGTERITPADGNTNDLQYRLYYYAKTKNNPIELDRK